MYIKRLTSSDVNEVKAAVAVFAAAFQDDDDYVTGPASDEYLQDTLSKPDTIVLVAMTAEGEVVGGILAYLLHKLQGTKEIYLYDLAVAEAYRRQGIATSLITELARIAKEYGASSLFVQADNEDKGAVALYTKQAIAIEKDITQFELKL